MTMLLHRLGLLALSALLAACSHAGSKAMAGPQPVKIGFLAPLTGPESDSGRATLAAAQLAADHVNAAGGVSGHPLELVTGDTQAVDGAHTALPLAHAMAEQGVAAFVVQGSGATRAVLEKVAKPRGIPVLTPSASGAELSRVKDGGLLFRTVPSDADFAKAIARVLMDDRQAKVALLARDQAFGRSVDPELRATLGARYAGSVLYPDQADDVLNRIPTGTTAVLLLGAPQEQAALLKQWQADPQRRPYRWYVDARHAETAPGHAKALEGMKGLAPLAAEGPHFQAFRRAFKQKTRREPDAEAARTYDTVMLTALAMVMGGASTPAAIQRNVVAVSSDGARQRGLGPDGVKDAISVIRSGTDLDYEGASGAMDLDAKGDVHGDYTVWVWRSGTRVDTGEVIRF